MDFYPTSLYGLLREHRKNRSLLDSKVRKILAFQLFKALYYLEQNNVCHRDLKPPNILLNDQTNELKICDFGSAKIFDRK
jgi:serine/threonine protein kinase